MNKEISFGCNQKELTKHQTSKFNIKLCKFKLDCLMETLDEYKYELIEKKIISINSNSIVKFNSDNFSSFRSEEDKYITKSEFDATEYFFKRLDYLTNKVFSLKECLYFMNLYYDHFSKQIIMQNFANNDRDFRLVRESAIVKAAKVFHCAVMKETEYEKEVINELEEYKKNKRKFGR